MPRIICLTCGREVYATAPVEQLFTDERRCPRCGSPLDNDRRATDRRIKERRENPPGDPGPPDAEERRISERRGSRRRRGDAGGTLDPRRRGWIE